MWLFHLLDFLYEDNTGLKEEPVSGFSEDWKTLEQSSIKTDFSFGMIRKVAALP